MGVSPDQFRKMQDCLSQHGVKQNAVVEPFRPPFESRNKPVISVDLSAFYASEFVYRGAPIGKPRMTQRDKFMKRPCVMRYRAYADGLRAAAGLLPELPDLVVVSAYVEVKPSWSQVKKCQMIGKPCRSKPDWDNIAKGVVDALFENDECIWLGVAVKYWCAPGDQRVEVKVFYAKPE